MEKYGKCAQFDYILREDTGVAKLCPVFSIVVSHQSDKPNEIVIFWVYNLVWLLFLIVSVRVYFSIVRISWQFTWSCLERNCINRKINRCIVSLSASSRSTILWVYPGNALPSSTIFSECIWPSVRFANINFMFVPHVTFIQTEKERTRSTI